MESGIPMETRDSHSTPLVLVDDDGPCDCQEGVFRMKNTLLNGVLSVKKISGAPIHPFRLLE